MRKSRGTRADDSGAGIRVPVLAPYRLDLTAVALRRLSTNLVDVFDGTTYRRLIGDPRAPLVFSATQTASDELHVRIDGAGAERFDAAAVAVRMLGTNVDLTEFSAASRAFPWLAHLVDAARGVKPPRYSSLWEACVNAVVFQQISIHAAGAILRRVIARYEMPVTVHGAEIYPFPLPGTIADAEPDELRGLGLSINKVVALKHLARAIIAGDLDEVALDLLPTLELTATIQSQRGIGPWTAAVIALRGFARLDVFPMNDSGAARSLRELSGENAVDVDAILDRLGPARGMLYYHLLLGRLAARGEIVL